MADNVQITAGAGTTIATDDVAGVQFQKVKIDLGGDGASIPAAGTAAGALYINLRNNAGTEIGTDANPVRTSPASGAAVQPVNDNGSTLSVDDGSGSLTVDAPVGTPVFVRLSDGASAISALPVTDNSSTLSVDDGGGSLTVDGQVTAVQGNAGTIGQSWFTKVGDGTNFAGVTNVGGNYGLKVDVIQTTGPTAQADKSGFVEGTGTVLVAGGVVNDAIGADPGEDQAAALRITVKRGLHVNLRNVGGTEIGTDANPIRTSPSSTAAVQPVSDNGSTLSVDDGGGSLTVDQSGTWAMNLTQIAGSAISAAAAGIPKVGVVDSSGTAVSETNPLYVQATKMKKTPKRVTIAYSASSSGDIWTPTAGKKFILESVIVSVGAAGAGLLKVYDHSNDSDHMIVNATYANSQQMQYTFAGGHPSSAANNVLRWATGAGAAGDITVFGYESD